MAYRLKPKVPLAETLRDTARGEVTAALASLEQLPEEEAIHELRKHCKKLRALLRLVRTETCNLYRYENAHYRTLANALAGNRDAVSMRDALLALAPTGSYPQIQHYLEERVHSHRDPDVLGDARVLLKQGGERIDDWPLEQLKWKHACKGYKKYYRRAFKTMENAFAGKDATSCHEFRKRMKDHWYHCRLLEKKHKDAAKPRRKPLKKLAQALGDWRDLRLLCSLLGKHSGKFSGELIPLLDAAETRLNTLDREIRRMSERLFAAKEFNFNGD